MPIVINQLIKSSKLSLFQQISANISIHRIPAKKKKILHWHPEAANIFKICVREQKWNIMQPASALCIAIYLVVSHSEGDMVKLVNVSRFDGCCYDLGVDSDFPCSRIPWVVGDTWVAARLQDVADAVIPHKHHWHTSWWAKTFQQRQEGVKVTNTLGLHYLFSCLLENTEQKAVWEILVLTSLCKVECIFTNLPHWFKCPLKSSSFYLRVPVSIISWQELMLHLNLI